MQQILNFFIYRKQLTIYNPKSNGVLSTMYAIYRIILFQIVIGTVSMHYKFPYLIYEIWVEQGLKFLQVPLSYSIVVIGNKERIYLFNVFPVLNSWMGPE